MMLEVRDLHAFYGKSHILQGVNLSVGKGEIVSRFRSSMFTVHERSLSARIGSNRVNSSKCLSINGIFLRIFNSDKS